MLPRGKMTYEDRICNLRTAEFAEGEECILREQAVEVARTADVRIALLELENARLDQAQEEIAQLQSGIASLRSDLINQRDVLVYQFRSLGAYNGAYLQPKMAVIEDVLRALGALVPDEESE